MSILDTVEAKIGIAEQDVVTFFTKFFAAVKQEEQVIIDDLAKVLHWIEAHGADVSQLVLGIVTTVAAAGVGVPAPVITAAALLNDGVQQVNNAIALAQQQGASTVQQAVAAGSAAYGAFNHAKSVLAAPAKTS